MKKRILKSVFLSLSILTLWVFSIYAEGQLLVVLEPPLAFQPDEYGNKAQWRVDGVVWQDSFAVVFGLSEGVHKVDFKELSGWIEPEPQEVNINTNITTTISATYIGFANTFYSSRGFDHDEDGQTDFIDVTIQGAQDKLLAAEVPIPTGGEQLYIESSIGGMTAPRAYFPKVEEVLYDKGKNILIGNGTIERPQLGSSLEFRTILYNTTGVNALKAFYTKAIQAFTPKLLKLLEAEEHFREVLRVNPYNRDALNLLLETYYARAEGFMLVGNDYMATAYKHKFEPSPVETRSITDLEVQDISSALICYETGFREFMKLFNPAFTGLGAVLKPHLDIDPEWLFFDRRVTNPLNPNGPLVSYESLRGQKNAIGVSSHAFNSAAEEVGPVQGSPNFEVEVVVNISDIADIAAESAAGMKRNLAENTSSNNSVQWNTVDAPVKFQLPGIEGAPTYLDNSNVKLRFDVDVDPGNPVQTIEIVVEFDHEKLSVPSTIDNLDFSDSDFPINTQYYGPGSMYEKTQLFTNQILIRAENSAAISGTGLTVVKIPFHIKAGSSGSFYVYGAGSGGSLLSGYKDIAILYRLAAAHADATAEKAKRLYNIVDQDSRDNSISLIQDEVNRIGGWFEHIQALLNKSATPTELASIDQLQSAINQVSSELNDLSSLREFIRSGANVFGFPDDYVPFYNSGQTESFDAIRNLVVGSGSFTPQTAGGFFGIAREAETAAVLAKDKFDDTKDRIRGEIFTVNEQAESRLVQICGRIDNGEPSFSTNDAIDYDLQVSPRNAACEIGQNVLLMGRARKVLAQALADTAQFIQDIEFEKIALRDEVALKEEIPGILEEYKDYQQNLDREIGRVNAQQTRLNAITQATSTVLSAKNVGDIFTGDAFSKGAIAAIQLANGMEQANLENRKGEIQAEKTRLAAEERIRLTEIDTEIFKIERSKVIEQMVNDIVLKNLSAQIAEIDVQIALGRLNQLISERDELIARRGRQIANLGEMSFADPSFRLTQFNSMKESETQLEFLKRWLYVMTRTLYYKWALQDDYKIQIFGLPDVSIHDINRIQVVGALNEGIQDTPLEDNLTASDYVRALITFNDTAPTKLVLSETQEITRVTSGNTARYSIREDFLRIVRTANTPDETQRVRDQFRSWLKSPDRLDANGDLVIEFNTMGHLENYNLPVNKDHGKWKNFALRSFSNLPLWNHKITRVGVALKAVGLAFVSGVPNVNGSIEFGGTGFVKGNSRSGDDFLAFQMRQWRDLGNGRLEPIDVRTVPLSIPSSAVLESSENTYMVSNLIERPVTSTLWRLKILKSELAKIELDNIEDIFVYIFSKAYQAQ